MLMWSMTRKDRQWVSKGYKPTPVAEGGVAVTITAKYGAAGPCDFISVRHYPKTGVLEYGEYESDESPERPY